MQRLGEPAEDLSTRAQKPARRKGSRIYGSALHHQNGGATPGELAPLFCPPAGGSNFLGKNIRVRFAAGRSAQAADSAVCPLNSAIVAVYLVQELHFDS
jgi:hypothetical protein